MTNTKLEVIIVQADISRIGIFAKVDAIVNPTNSDLDPGSGADAAIQYRAGIDKLQSEIRKQLKATNLNYLPVAQTLVTPAFDIEVKKIIHTVAPHYEKSGSERYNLMQLCFENIFACANQYNLPVIALPLIGNGVYHWKLEEWAMSFKRFMDSYDGPAHKVYVCPYANRSEQNILRQILKIPAAKVDEQIYFNDSIEKLGWKTAWTSLAKVQSIKQQQDLVRIDFYESTHYNSWMEMRPDIYLNLCRNFRVKSLDEKFLEIFAITRESQLEWAIHKVKKARL